MTVNGETCRAVEINGKVYHSVQEMIERIIDLEKVNEWHDLRKKPNDLPKNRDCIIAYCRGDYYDACYYNGKTFITHGEADVLKWKEIV